MADVPSCPVRQYAESVLSGVTPAGRLVRQAAQRHLDDLAQGPARGLTWDAAAARRVIAFFSFLKLSKGLHAGQPFHLQPWQAFFVGLLFGWKRGDNRRFRRGCLWVPKKNGKSCLSAGLVLYGLVADGEAGAEVYGAAADRGQASIIWREVEAMVRQTPALVQRLRPLDTTKRVVFEQVGSFYAVLSKDSRKTGHGINASLCVIDELHVVDRELYDTLRYAGAARRQPLMIEISTAGNDRDSLGFERYTYARRLLEGESAPDDETLALIYQADNNDAWQDPEQWQIANPSLGVTIPQEAYASDFREALASPPATQANFKQLRLNLWQDSIFTWIPLERWDACQGTLPDLTGCPCWGGLDLSAKMDLTAWVLCFQVGEDYWLLPRFWAPKEGDRRRESDNRTLLRPWMAAGHIEPCAGDTINTDQIEARVVADCEQYRVGEIAVDDWNALSVINHLQAKVYANLVVFPQTLRNYNEPMKEFERLVYQQRIHHDGNPVLRWCVANTAAYLDPSGNIRPDKKHSQDRIDGSTAAVMALARALVAGMGTSVYETNADLAL